MIPQNSSGIARSRHMLFFFWTVPDDEMYGILTLSQNGAASDEHYEVPNLNLKF